MKTLSLCLSLSLCLLAVPCSAQIYVPSNTPSSGNCNVIPFGSSATWSTGYTLMARIPASFMTAGFVVDDISFAPCGTGTWSSATVFMGIGHISSPQPCPFTFPSGSAAIGSFSDFTVLWDSTMGPFTWNVTQDTWSPMGFAATGGTGFTWDGLSDVGFFITFQNAVVAGWSGSFHRSSSEPARSYSSGYLAVTSTTCAAPTGLKMCLTPSLGPSIIFSQSLPGTLQVDNGNLVLGAETWNIVTINDPCPNGPGSGPLLGLCASTPGAVNLLLSQFSSPASGANPFHFAAPGTATTWGPFGIAPGLTFEGICLYVDPASGSVRVGPVDSITTM